MTEDLALPWSEMSEATRKLAFERLKQDNTRLRGERDKLRGDLTAVKGERDAAVEGQSLAVRDTKRISEDLAIERDKFEQEIRKLRAEKLELQASIASKDSARVAVEQKTVSLENQLVCLRKELGSKNHSTINPLLLDKPVNDTVRSSCAEKRNTPARYPSLLGGNPDTVRTSHSSTPLSSEAAASASVISSSFSAQYESIQVYFGFSDLTPIQEWLESFDKLFQLYGPMIPASQRSIFLRSKLGGQADRSVSLEENKLGRKLTIFELSEFLLKNYNTESQQSFHEILLDSIVQREDESISEYFSRLIRQGKLAMSNDHFENGTPNYNILDSIIRRQIVKGCRSDIKNQYYCIPRPFNDSLDQIIERLQSCELAIRERRAQGGHETARLPAALSIEPAAQAKSMTPERLSRARRRSFSNGSGQSCTRRSVSVHSNRSGREIDHSEFEGDYYSASPSDQDEQSDSSSDQRDFGRFELYNRRHNSNSRRKVWFGDK